MNKHCLSKNIPLLSKSLLLKIIRVTSELSQRGTGLLEGYYFTKRSDISFRISIFRSIEISSYRTIGFQFEILPPPLFPRCASSTIYPLILSTSSLPSNDSRAHISRSKRGHGTNESRRERWKVGWIIEDGVQFVPVLATETAPSVCLLISSGT